MSSGLIFFGSGPVAAASLKHVVENFGIDLVVTKKRPLHHKEPAPVEDYANSTGIEITFAESKQELLLLFQNLNNCQLGLVIDYGVIIPSKVIHKFKYGIVNSHFSILPEWRGADPITFALLSGQNKTGVSLMLINEKMDEGELLSQKAIEINKSDDNQSLTNKLIETSNELIDNVLPVYLKKELALQPQQGVATYSRKISKQDGFINWSKPASVIEREIRAFKDWPNSKSLFGKVSVIISQAQASNDNIPLGQIVISSDNTLLVGCGIGSLRVIKLKPLGKNEMDSKSFINGYKSRLDLD